MNQYINADDTLTEEQMQAELDAHFAELNAKIAAFQRRRSGKFEYDYTYIEHVSIEYMIHWYIRIFNDNLKESGYGFETEWDTDDWLYILYKNGKLRTVNPSCDDGNKRIVVDGIDSLILDGSWGSCYAGPHVKIYNMREAVDYGKWGYKDLEQRYKDFDDIRLDFED